MKRLLLPPGAINEPERTLTYFYDCQGNITSRRFQAGVTGQSFFTWYDYDGFGRLSEIRTNTTNSYTDANIDAAYTYSATGNRQNLSLNQGSNSSWMEEVDYSYNMRGWLTSINDPIDLEGRSFGMELHYYSRLHGSSGGNYNGNISDIRWSTPSADSQLHTYQYYYDRANRLVGANYKESGIYLTDYPYNVRGSNTPNVQVTDNFDFTQPIGYDANGNFQSLRRNNDEGGKQVYNYSYYPGTNRLRNTNGSDTADNYLYDAAGNVTANSERNISNITYDHRNLTQHISTDNGLHLYTYNSEGLRIGKQFRDVVNDSMTVNKRYIYGAYGELIAQFGGAGVDYWNISGPGGEGIGRKGQTPPIGIGDLMSMESGTYEGYMRYYYLKDHLGSVRVTLNQNGSVVGHDDYYPFGLQMPGRSNNSANRDDDQKFTGHFFEQEGDLEIYHAQARMYDPAIGRFLGVDAMRGKYPTINSYHYTLNNPVIYTDPTGMWVAKFGGEAIGAVVPVTAGNFSVGVVVDKHGNFGTYQTGGVAYGVILGGVAGVGGKLYPMADNIHDIAGSGVELAAFAAAGKKGGRLAFDPSISDLGPGIGGAWQVGAGVGLYLNFTQTTVQQWGNIWDLFGSDASGEIMDKMQIAITQGEEIKLDSIFSEEQLEVIRMKLSDPEYD
ncbi:MAG: hypothetical protein LAT84_13145 [Balneolia bacterium]|nr:hypothetical protein [Balneolia bacterium]